MTQKLSKYRFYYQPNLSFFCFKLFVCTECAVLKTAKNG